MSCDDLRCAIRLQVFTPDIGAAQLTGLKEGVLMLKD
jgi:hypothetical protein